MKSIQRFLVLALGFPCNRDKVFTSILSHPLHSDHYLLNNNKLYHVLSIFLITRYHFPLNLDLITE